MPDKIPTPREMANAHPKHGGLMNEWGMQRRASYIEGVEAERDRSAKRLKWLEAWAADAVEWMDDAESAAWGGGTCDSKEIVARLKAGPDKEKPDA